ncbi:Nitrogen regulatory protein P-II 1 [Methylacidimicrobium cyclopophantes]|uniref:Nitrogen regulatory protein P-II 1 n=1 Tax=Methylacidimicrobium cyclopophantes TaxID=1041766 RepID=A0A5E6MEJ3_9BACT|nr:P-II family nitrogen regulator [Methylacidimicrobium cyclopophantes]VVM07525.1 Nitrogen regulatory protein P-II 1 [Methylacidimicrobium cyclopophantes]
MRDSLTVPDPLPSIALFQKVEAIVPRFCLGTLREALADRGIRDALVSRVKRFDQAPQETEQYLGNEYLPDFLPQTKIELVVPTEMVSTAVNTILRQARIRESTNQVVLSPILNVISIDPQQQTQQKSAGIADDLPKNRTESMRSLR